MIGAKCFALIIERAYHSSNEQDLQLQVQQGVIAVLTQKAGETPERVQQLTASEPCRVQQGQRRAAAVPPAVVTQQQPGRSSAARLTAASHQRMCSAQSAATAIAAFSACLMLILAVWWCC